MRRLKNKNLEYYSERKILNPPPHVKDEIQLIMKLIEKNNSLRIVDFGSGGGRLTVPLLKQGYKILAVDIDQEVQKQLKKISEKLKLDRNLNIANILKKGGKYDYIVGTDILHHIDLNKYFLIFKNHLKRGGKIIFSEPNPLNFFWLIFISLFSNWNEEKGVFACNYFNLKNQLKSAGFKNIKIKGFALLPPQIFYYLKLGFLNEINYFISKLPLINLFAYRYLIYGEKN